MVCLPIGVLVQDRSSFELLGVVVVGEIGGGAPEFDLYRSAKIGGCAAPSWSQAACWAWAVASIAVAALSQR
jgi:hypothetical protein